MHRADEIILHIGFAKTGTTALQQYLLSRKQDLLAQGVLWPGLKSNHYHLHTIASKDPHSLFQVINEGLSREEVQIFAAAWRKSFLDEIDEMRPRRILLSTEFLNGALEEELSHICAFLAPQCHRLRLLAYVRDPWSMAVSTAQQNIIDGLWAEPVELDFVLEHTQALAKFERAFRTRVEVRLYQRDIISDFLGWLRLEGLKPKKETWINRSVGLYTACVLACMNRKTPGFDDKGRYLRDRARGWMVECLMNAFNDEPKIEMSRTTARLLLLKSESEIQLLQARYFGGRRVFGECFDPLSFPALTDDRIHIGRLKTETAARGLLVALRALAERGIWYHDEVERLVVRPSR